MFLPLRDTFVVTFNETHAPSSRKYTAEQVIVMPNWSRTFQTVSSHSSVFVLEKQLINLNFQSSFTSTDPLVAFFNETRAPTSRKHVTDQGIVRPNWSKIFQRFWSHSSDFAFGKTTWKAKLSELLYLLETLWWLLSMKTVHLLPEKI